jgi:hypothetical protein
VYAWRSPCRIDGCHGVDKFPDLGTGPWPTGLRRLG